MCQAAVMHKYPVPSGGGYLFLTNDVLVNPCIMPKFPSDHVWMSYYLQPTEYVVGARPLDETDRWFWSDVMVNGKTQEDMLHVAVHALRGVSHVLHFNATRNYGLKEDGTLARFYHPLLPHVYFVPGSFRAEFLTLGLHYAQHSIYSELELSYILSVITQLMPQQNLKAGMGEVRKEPNVFPQELLTKGGILTHDSDNNDGLWLVSVPPYVHLPSTIKWWVSLECPEQLDKF
eukprot:jgi/Botrbrau1/10920/Bobra.0025s0093.1